MLKLKTLHLDGFLSYDVAEIPLDKEGITFIQGETGAGKSTIFEAILYLLYGKTLRKRSSVNDLENKVLNHGYDISLEFELDDHSYLIKEVRNKKHGNGLFFVIDGEDRRGKTDPLTRARIKDIIKLSEEEFKNLVFLGQRQSQKFIEGTSGERAQLITELFGLEKYDLRLDNLESDLKNLVIEKERAVRIIDDVAKNITEIEKTIENQVHVEQVDEATFDAVEEEISTLEQELRRFRFDELKNKELLGKVEIIQKNVKKLEVLEDQIENLKKQLDSTPPAKYTHEELNRLLNKCKTKQALLTQNITNKEEELGKIGNCDNICPISKEVCSLSIPIQFQEIRAVEVQDELSSLSAQFDEISDKLSKVERLLLKSTDVDAIKKDLENKQHLFNVLQSSIDDVEETDVDKIRSNLSFFSQKIVTLDEKVSAKREVFNSLKTKKCLYDQHAVYASSLTTLLATKQQQLLENQQNMSDLTNKIQYLSAALLIFKKLKLYKIDLILDRINVNVQTQLDKISNALKINFSSLKRGSKGKTLDQLNITVLNNGIALPIEMLSGGQTTQIGLALLLGIYKTAFELSDKGVNLLFLDEAFGTLSDDIIDETFESIVELTKELGFNNVKIISHRALDSRRFDSIWQVERKNGISSLKVVN